MTSVFERAQLVTLAEQSEAEFMFQYESGAPAEAAAELGISTQRLEDGVVMVMRNDVTGYWNKALGFTSITDTLIGRILDIYRTEQAPVAVLQLAPDLLPEDWAEISVRHGLTEGGKIVKLIAPIHSVQPEEGKTDLRIGPVTPQDADEWGRLIISAFGMPSGGLDSMLAASVTNPNCRTFAAWDGDQIVAGGSLYLHKSAGVVNAGATAPTHRNRGAQSAIIAARIAAAQDAGCRWVVAEASQPAPGESNPSLNNLIRAGLQPLYVRSSWIWRPRTRW
ncbi:GNAT family N-acetyltransferase [Kribbella sp. NPDC051587]|uniref:GNAT family N-acetyltransferase n=1 Tax=Kribbella sp. NPDC051587 TaxID=3364119 RepID=UPI00379D5D3A